LLPGWFYFQLGLSNDGSFNMMANALREKVATLFFWLTALAVIGMLMLIVSDLFVKGFALLSIDYLIQPPRQAGLSGGISSILVGTILLVIVALAIAFPTSLGTAVLLNQFSQEHHRFAIFIRRSLDVLAGVPSIVFGLFGFKFFSEVLGLGWSILSGSLTLACMILPLTILGAEQGLGSASSRYGKCCAALGVSHWGALWNVLLPSATPSILAGLLLGLGRCFAETAAVMFTAGATTRMPASIFDSSRSLAYHIYIMSIEVPGGTSRAYAAALILVSLIAGISLMANLGSYYFLEGKLHE
jgi:phosphate transport system permease protein